MTNTTKRNSFLGSMVVNGRTSIGKQTSGTSLPSREAIFPT